MTLFLRIFFIGLAVIQFYIANGQAKIIFRAIEREIQIPFIIPDSLIYDSCYYMCTFLKVEFDKNSKLSSIQVADNSEEWVKSEIKRIRQKMNTKKIDSISAKNGYKNEIFLFPFIIQSDYFPCGQQLNVQNISSKQKFYMFDNKPLTGKMILGEKIEYIFIKPEFDERGNYPSPIKVKKINE